MQRLHIHSLNMSKKDQVKISVQQLDNLESYIDQLDLRKAKGLLYRVLHPEKNIYDRS